MAKIPAYRELYFHLKQNIQTNQYKPGTMLPTESELEEQFNVSRTTVRKAIGMLIAEGYLKATQGKGTEVLDATTSQPLNYITSITETLKKRGFAVSIQGMNIQKLPSPPEEITDMMKLPPYTPLYKLERLLYANGEPIAYMINYLRASSVPDFEKSVNKFTGLYHFLEEHYHIILRSAKEYLSAVAANFTEAMLLRIEPGAPLLCSRRVTSTDQGVLEYSVIKLLADKYEYTVNLLNRN